MAERRKARNVYYMDGTAARKRYYGTSPRKPEPVRRKRKLTEAEKKRRKAYAENKRDNLEMRMRAARKAESSRAFDFKYTVLLAVSVLMMVASAGAMLHMQTRVDEQQRRISNLKSELEEINADNQAYSDSLDSRYSLDEIYSIATGRLGMVYASKGQIIYYDSAKDDYVTQYSEVPESR